MTFLLCVALFVAVSCLGLPLLLLALFAVWNPEPEHASAEEREASVPGSKGRGRRIDFSRTTV